MPEERMGERRYSSALDEGGWPASRPACSIRRERALGTQWIESWVGSWAGLEAVEQKYLFALAGIEASRPARRSWPVAIPTELSRLGWKLNANTSRKGEARWTKLGKNYKPTESRNHWADKPEAGTGSMKHWDTERDNIRSKPTI
jgi:hypothetical protein